VTPTTTLDTLPLGALLTLVSAAFAVSLADRRGASGRFAAWIAIAALLVAPALAMIVVLSRQSVSLQGMLVLDGSVAPALLLACASGAIAVLLELGRPRGPGTSRFALILFAVAGTVIVAQSTHLLPAVIGLAILSSALSALLRADVTWTHFVLRTVGLATTCLGTALLYGATGSLRIGVVVERIAQQATDGNANALVPLALGLLVAGLGLGIGLVPFHTWVAGSYERLRASESYVAGVLAPQAALALLAHFAGAWPGRLDQLIAWLGAVSVLYGYARALYTRHAARAAAGIVTAQAGLLVLHVLLPGGVHRAALYMAIGSYVLTGACLWAGIAGSSRFGSATVHSLGALMRRTPWLGAVVTVGVLNLSGLLPLLGATVQIQLFRELASEGYAGALLPAVVGYLPAWLLALQWILRLWGDPARSDPDPSAAPELTIVGVAAAGAILLAGLNADAIARWLVALGSAG
jgi:NADH-quinone oxidoreductase subunit N